MDDEFQLSVELYDTKDKKIVWSDRWQEKWDNLPTIKGSLSDGLLKALDTKPKVEKNIESDNAEAYGKSADSIEADPDFQAVMDKANAIDGDWVRHNLARRIF